MANRKKQEQDINALVEMYHEHQRVVQQYNELSGGDFSELLMKKYDEIEADLNDQIFNAAIRKKNSRKTSK